VLELVAGETLAERIARGPIPVDEAVTLAVKLAEAVDAAHEQGVIHRDLKPANIKLTPDDGVKVLDFGLAKGFDDSASAGGSGSGPQPASSFSPTITRNATQAGVLLGTAAYMSPEQAKGKSVDRRADVWAFGSPKTAPVLWEACGVAVGLAAGVLTAFWDRPPAVPEAPLRVFQVVEDMDYGAADISPDGRKEVFSRGRRLWVRQLDRPEPRELPDTSDSHGVFWSPDSENIAFVTGDELRRIALDGTASRRICGFDGVFQGGTWSGSRIVFAVDHQGLFEVPAGGRRAAIASRPRPFEGRAGDPRALFSSRRRGALVSNAANQQLGRYHRGRARGDAKGGLAGRRRRHLPGDVSEHGAPRLLADRSEPGGVGGSFFHSPT
jgi:hypothetical protein